MEASRGALAPGGLLVAEHAWDQGAGLRDKATEVFCSGGGDVKVAATGARIETKQDLAGLERVLVVGA